jgi:hypothetical protein
MYTRRQMLASAANLTPAAPVPAIRTEIDPIFAAIEAHRSVTAAFEAALDALGERRRSPETIAASRALKAAMVALVETKPTTLHGMLAVLNYANDEIAWDGFSSDNEWTFRETLRIALTEIVAHK